MQRPRRRAAGRPAGPPEITTREPADGPTSPAGQVPADRAVPDVHTDRTVPDVNTDRAVPDGHTDRTVPDGHIARTVPDGHIDRTVADDGASQHRRRQRAPRGATGGRAGDRDSRPSDAGAAEPSTPMPDPAEESPTAAGPARRQGGPTAPRERRGESAIERSLRALVSTRTTQLPFDVAMRAREVAQPSAQDLADAQRDLVLVRRHYVPPVPLATKKRDAAGRGGAGRPDDAGTAGDGRRGARRSGRG